MDGTGSRFVGCWLGWMVSRLGYTAAIEMCTSGVVSGHDGDTSTEKKVSAFCLLMLSSNG